MNDNFGIPQYLALGALSEQEDWDDEDIFEMDDDDDEDEDYDDEEGFEDDWDMESDYDDDDELFAGLADYDDDDDEEGFPERRRRRRRRRRSFRRPKYRRYGRRRRLKRVRGSRGTTLKTRGGRSLKVRFGKSYATSAEVNKLIKDTERKFALAVKERKANFDRLSKQISKATANLDGKVNSVRKSVKKVEDQAKTNALLGLLQPKPKVKSIRFSDPITANTDLSADVEFERSNNSLGLILALSGGLGGGKSGGMDPLMMALAFGGLGR